MKNLPEYIREEEDSPFLINRPKHRDPILAEKTTAVLLPKKQTE